MNQDWAACVVSYNNQASLNNLLLCLDSQSLLPKKVYIVDNSEQSLSIDTFNNLEIKFIKNLKNEGFGAAVNKGVTEAIKDKFEKFILFSQDVILEEDTCYKLINELNNKDAIVFPRMLNRKTGNIFSLGGFISKISGKIYLETKNVKTNFEWADGSCLAFTKNVFLANSGFNEKYFMYFEDVDFCYRAKQKGYNLFFCDTTTSQIPNGPSPFLRSKNSTYFAKVNNKKYLLVIISLRNLAGVIKLALKLRYTDALQRFKGIKAGLK